MSPAHHSPQLRVVGNRWLAAGIDAACANAPKLPPEAAPIAFAKAHGRSSVAQSQARSPITGCAPPTSPAIARHRAGGKSP